MRRMTRGTPRQRAAAGDKDNRPDGDTLPDGIGGTITGGPVAMIDLMRILERGSGGASRGGAVSGAAQVVVSNVLASDRQDRGIALSDGSRISFASLADAGVLRQEDDSVRRHEDDSVRRREEVRHLVDA